MSDPVTVRAPRNRTLTLSADDHERYRATLTRPPLPASLDNAIVHGDTLALAGSLRHCFADLLFLDPPYNLNREFGGATFRALSLDAYERWFEGWFVPLLPALKPAASIYVCGDWRSAAALQRVLSKHLILRNRITWEREKGRGARANWKNGSEDIWFGTLGDDYYFCADAVKLKRRVLAPYRENGQPKDWTAGADGAFRLTHPSNIWTDLTVPYWSMKENTPHPTQKPEKLLAKIILASSRPGDCVLDPFLGSGTTATVAVKLGRRFVGIEQDEAYCCLAAKRVALAEQDKSIQGYVDGVFWERNSLREQKKAHQPHLL